MAAECRSMRCNKSYQGVTTSCNARGHGSTNGSIFYHPHRHTVPSTELLGRQYGHQPVEPGLQPRHNAGLPLRIDLGRICLQATGWSQACCRHLNPAFWQDRFKGLPQTH
jgi:hypothetical protein